MVGILLLLSACSSSDDTGSSTACDPLLEVGYADLDGDGYGDLLRPVTECEALPWVSSFSDCDDGDSGVHPEAEEICDGVDQDCDGEIDVGAVDASLWYLDADGDGSGDPEASQESCTPLEGRVLDKGDCDDTDPDILPGAPEFCDGVDTDCDGTLDEDDAEDARSWFKDADKDGYGDPASTASACTAPSGYVADDSDCDDTLSETWPGAPELCNGWDDNCDGEVDEVSAVDAGTWYPDSDGDGFGDPDLPQPGCTAPSGFVADAQDCMDTDALVHPDGVEVCDGVDNDCDGTSDNDDATDAPTWYLDADGDGWGDPSSAYTACEQASASLSTAGDCDDANANTHPGADEYCDSVDNDCDGTTDESDAVDASQWYTDGDSDGYGDTSSVSLSCTQPTGSSAVDGDCDDGDAAVSPAATELCDTIDNDCDGDTDEADAADATDWYADSDQDGYGDASTVTAACSAPSGYTSDSSDCDDSDDTVWPGAVEVCDTVDNDCDGSVDGVDVPGDYSTVQDAIDGSSSGDLICVSAGTYYEQIDFSGKDVWLMGTEGSASTILDGNGSGPVVTVDSGESTSALLQGFTVTGGNASQGSGLYIKNSGITLTDVAADGNTHAAQGGGLYAYNATLLISESSFNNNSATSGGCAGVALFLDASSVSIQGSTISENDCTVSDSRSVGGPVVYQGGGTLSLSDTSLDSNSVSLEGSKNSVRGAVFYQASGTATLDTVSLDGNTVLETGSGSLSTLRGGLLGFVSGSTTLTDVSITNAETDGSYIEGGLLNCYGGTQFDVDGLEISDSSSTIALDADGGLIHLDGCDGTWTDLSISSTDVVSNATSANYGGLFYSSSSTLDFEGLEVTENSYAGSTEDLYGGLLYFGSVGSPPVTISDFDVSSNLVDGFDGLGGGLLYFGHQGTLTQGSFSGNAFSNGRSFNGSVYHVSTASGTNLISAGNTVDVTGTSTGLGFYTQSVLSLTNVDLVGNTTSSSGGSCYGGGAFVSSGSLTLLNTNISDHTTCTGGAVYGSSATFSATYSNFYNNGATALTNVSASSTTNLAVDPAYTDVSASDPADWDLSLSSTSSCIDAGDPSLLDPDTSTSDIGAYGGPDGAW